MLNLGPDVRLQADDDAIILSRGLTVCGAVLPGRPRGSGEGHDHPERRGDGCRSGIRGTQLRGTELGGGAGLKLMSPGSSLTPESCPWRPGAGALVADLLIECQRIVAIGERTFVSGAWGGGPRSLGSDPPPRADRPSTSTSSSPASSRSDETLGAISPQRLIARMIGLAQQHLRNGVTTVRDLGS